MNFSSEGLVIDGHSDQTLPGGHFQAESGLAQDSRLMTIHMLPDDVLLEIFGFHECVDKPLWHTEQDTWRSLVHVCRRWRYLVFASPRRLNTRLPYRGYRPMSEVLDVWPVLPISLISIDDQSDPQWENTVAALESEHSSRICEMYIDVTDSRWKGFAAAMQKPFPELIHLRVWMLDDVPVLPDLFLGGSAPRLRTLRLISVPFPSLPKLLLSANGLVELDLWFIPDSGYLSPDDMVTALAVMTSLESLDLHFLSPRSRPDPASQPLLSLTPIVLPALTTLIFEGVYEYLEGLLARIDLPRLFHLRIIFFMDIVFDVPHLHRLIGHAEKFKTFDHAEVSIHYYSIRLCLYPTTGAVEPQRFDLQIICGELDKQLSSLCKVCSSSFPLISSLEELQIREDESLPSSHLKDDMENARWLEFLYPFTAVKNLYLADGVAQRFCDALQGLSGERTTKVLPALRNLFVRGSSSLEPVQEAMKPLVAARQLSGHPVVVDRWKD